MTTRPRHTDKEVEDAVSYAESRGWRVVLGSNHAWAKLLCPHADRSGCVVFVWSTPKNAGNHARDIKRAIEKCTHGGEDE